jgi:hypothetical protein
LKVEGFGQNIKEFRGFFINWPAATAWTGLGAICAVDL